jgi:RNA polymerase sigma-70 factor (ECF subfamily)
LDENEFAGRTEQLKSRLFRTAMMYLKSESLALDAVDEAVYRGLRALKKLRQPEYFDTWLTRILINECKKELRRRKREQPLDTLPETASEEFDALPLREALGKLPPELRGIVILRFFSGYTLAETAETLGIPQGTAATRQRRALSLLKLELEDSDG